LARFVARRARPSPCLSGAWRRALVDFLEQVETWVPNATNWTYAILDNLNSHRDTDVLLFLLAYPRPEMEFPL
jgi:hypothetical protein